MVSSGIGLHLELKGLLSAGARAVVLGAVACATMSTLTLAVLCLATRGAVIELLIVCGAALGGALAAFQLARRGATAVQTTRRRVAPPRWRRSAALLSAGAALTGSGAHRRVTGEHPAT